MAQVAGGNLWRSARRPLDLEWQVDIWRENRRLGSLAEILETIFACAFREPDSDRARRDPLDATRATHALQRIGEALVLGRNAAIAIPDR